MADKVFDLDIDVTDKPNFSRSSDLAQALGGFAFESLEAFANGKTADEIVPAATNLADAILGRDPNIKVPSWNSIMLPKSLAKRFNIKDRTSRSIVVSALLLYLSDMVQGGLHSEHLSEERAAELARDIITRWTNIFLDVPDEM